MSIFKKKENTNDRKFLEAYKEISDKYGYDLESAGFFCDLNGKMLPEQRSTQFNKEFQQFLHSRKVMFHFTFKVIERKKSDAE